MFAEYLTTLFLWSQTVQIIWFIFTLPKIVVGEERWHEVAPVPLVPRTAILMPASDWWKGIETNITWCLP